MKMVDVLFGPAVGSLFAAAMDILKLLLYPTGAWIPGLTLNCLLAGLIYGFSCTANRQTFGGFWRRS